MEYLKAKFCDAVLHLSPFDNNQKWRWLNTSQVFSKADLAVAFLHFSASGIIFILHQEMHLQFI